MDSHLRADSFHNFSVGTWENFHDTSDWWFIFQRVWIDRGHWIYPYWVDETKIQADGHLVTWFTLFSVTWFGLGVISWPLIAARVTKNSAVFWWHERRPWKAPEYLSGSWWKGTICWPLVLLLLFISRDLGAEKIWKEKFLQGIGLFW